MKKRHAQSGVTLVEAAIGATLVAVALVGTSGAVFSSVLLQETTTRKRTAARAVSSLIADVRASDIGDLVANYDGTTHSIDYGSGQNATAAVAVAEAPGTAGARPVYRVQISLASAGAELDDALTFVAFVCDHSDSVSSGTRLADVATPDGVLLDWITDTEVAMISGSPVDSDDSNSLTSGESDDELDDDESSLTSSPMDSDEYALAGSGSKDAETIALDDDGEVSGDAAKYDALLLLVGRDYQ